MKMKIYKILRCCVAALPLLSLAACGDDEPDAPAVVTPPAPGGDSATYPRRAALTVIDYNPAPGQFVNVIPEYLPGMAYTDMVDAASASLRAGDMITLGAFGGSVTIRLDEPIYNVSGSPDLQVLGNAFEGSAEPGFVQVMADTNGNGLPDDGPWLLLGGEKFDADALVSVVYYPPAADATDAEYIRWTSHAARTGAPIGEGWLSRNVQYHTQSYMPDWDVNSIEPDGTLVKTFWMLPSNVTCDATSGIYRMASYAGYADSYPNNSTRSYLDLDNALLVDASGAVSCVPERIDFVRITTGVLGNNGPLGEISTEVAGINLLHP